MVEAGCLNWRMISCSVEARCLGRPYKDVELSNCPPYWERGVTIRAWEDAGGRHCGQREALERQRQGAQYEYAL